jgi:hypothetical protein
MQGQDRLVSLLAMATKQTWLLQVSENRTLHLILPLNGRRQLLMTLATTNYILEKITLTLPTPPIILSTA